MLEQSSKSGGIAVKQKKPDALQILIVDDSAVIRGSIRRILDTQEDFIVADTASNGEIAIQALRRHPVEVIILDIEMPVMDGLAAIPKLKEVSPHSQIIMASTLTQKNAEISLKAMSLGAADYIPKPSSLLATGAATGFEHEIIEKVRELGLLARRRGLKPAALREQPSVIRQTVAENKQLALRAMPTMIPNIIAIGSSTGGPQALLEVIKNLGVVNVPVMITQHMPPAFTTILAQHIATNCQVKCAEAKEGEILKSGQYYLAPGDFHMVIKSSPQGPTLHLTKDPPENFCRPAVDPMLRSIASVYGKNVLTVILTGMGQDGLRGSEAVIAAGGCVMAQDEASSVVWGMPGAVANAGICSLILPLNEIGQRMRQIVTRAGS